MFNQKLLSIDPSISALSLVSLIVMMGSSMVSPELVLYAQQDLGAGGFLVGAVIAGFAIGRLMFDIPAGFLADRLGINRTMFLGLGVLVGSSVLAGLAPSYWVLLLARVMEGIGSSIYVGAAVSFVLLASDATKRGTNVGTYQSILMLGPIIGPVVGAPIAALFGYNSPYFAFAGMMLVALVVISILNYMGRFHVERAAASASPGARDGQASSVMLYVNTAAIATFGFAFLRSCIYTTGMPLFAYGHLSLSVYDVGIILTMASLANLATSFFSGRITRRYGMKTPLFAAILFSAVLAALIPASTAMIHLLVIITLIGVTSGFFGQSIVWAAEQIEERVRKREQARNDSSPSIRVHSHVTRGIGFNRMVGDLGLVLGPLFVGFIVSVFSDNPVLWFASFGSTSAVLAAVSFAIYGLRKSAK
jgi:MFS family permease